MPLYLYLLKTKEFIRNTFSIFYFAYEFYHYRYFLVEFYQIKEVCSMYFYTPSN